jgi:rod shape determining protein RodA
VVLLSAALGLCAAGALSVYAATARATSGVGRSGTYYVDRVAINVAIGLVLAVIGWRCGVGSLRPYIPVLYAGTCLLLLVVLSPLGATINGAHAWFKIGPVELEPNELAKLAVILIAAAILGDRRDAARPSAASLLQVLGLTAVPGSLVLAEPALGVTIVIAVLVPVLFAISGAPTPWLFGLIVGAVLLVVAAVGRHQLKPNQEQRLTSFAHPGAHVSSTGYHTSESIIAIGDGGLTGRGFLRGQQTNGQFVPEQQTDFVFTVAAEEGGFVAAATIVALVGTLLLRGLRIARRAHDMTERLVAVGIVTWLGVQAFVNVGMTMGIMPVTGLPLPLVSYGGSAMFADLFAIGLLLRIGQQPRPSTAMRP